jgi:HPt (histidine-containing phosphotransfer) domain-containing protein
MTVSSLSEFLVFDRSNLLETLWGDEESLNSVIVMFLDEITAELSQLSKAVNEGDLTASAEIAHKMKGMSRNMRAHRMGEVFAEIEKESKAGNSPALDSLIMMLESEIQEFTRVYFGG